jgi:hypothetical protein
MPEGLATPDGKAVEVAIDPPVDVPPPPRMTDADKAEVAARSAETKRRGRPPKSDRARVEAPKPASEELPQKDYTEALDGALTGVWLATAGLPFTTPYAAVLNANKAGLVGALNAGANQNAKVRANVERFTGGGAGLWQLQLAVVGAQMGMQTMQLMKDKELREQAAAATRKQLHEWLKANGLVAEQDSGIATQAEEMASPGPVA